MEWQGFNAGCVKTQVKKRPWTHWYKLPFIDYGDTSGAQQAVEAVTAPEVSRAARTLKLHTTYFLREQEAERTLPDD